MVLVLVVGDLHIPHRAAGIPEAFRKMFIPGRIGAVLITGNVCNQETYEYFKSFTPNVHCARGEYDEWAKDMPETVTTEIEDLKFGIIHGHQVVPWGDKDSLAMIQRKLDVDILISGNTHASKTFEFDGRLFVNPGSITGAYSPFESDVTPTFVLLDVKGSSITSFNYQWDGSDVKIKKKEWTKGKR